MVTKKAFGKTASGFEASLYTIKNAKGAYAEVTDFGAILVNLCVPNKNGELLDVVLGFDSVTGYETNPSFFGATIGPNANRIANAKFTIDGVEYSLVVNDNANNLHSDANIGYHKLPWKAECGDNCVKFSLEDPDMNMGFPGNKKVSVTYTFTDDCELKIAYKGVSDKNTTFNMTNHTYFNLNGHNSGKIEGLFMQINASKFTPGGADLIPTGEFADVAGTPFDFTSRKMVGLEINADNAQLKSGKGYDHNFCIDNADGTMRLAAVCDSEQSGIKMEVYTDLPGIQFYAGNCISPITGKYDTAYAERSGLCLETQVYPDSINKPNFPNAVFGPGNDYVTETVYKFMA